MANKIILKKSSVSGKSPTTADLEYGELALNYADGKLYYKTSADTIDYISTDSGGGSGGDPGGDVRVLGEFNTRSYTGDGTTTDFTVSSGLNSSGVIVTENGILQLPETDYTISNTTLSFTTAPANTVQIQIREIIFSDLWTQVNAAYTASKNQKLFVDCSSAAVTVTLPASPVMGDEVTIVDAAGLAATNNITIARNGHNIAGAAENLVVDINDAAITLAYYNSTRGWLIVSK